MKLEPTITEEVEQLIQLEKSYIAFVKEIEAQVEHAFEYIDYAIECKTSSQNNHKNENYSKLDIPIRDILLLLLNIYQVANNQYPKSLKKDYYSFSQAIEHLHCATRHLVFYLENENLDLQNLEYKINHHLINYYDLKQQAIETMYTKFLAYQDELMKLETIHRYESKK